MGRNYSHCESSKTQSGASNDILGKKFSVQLSRENSQRLYSDSKTIHSHNGVHASRPQTQTSSVTTAKQISKWLPIKCNEKSRKQQEDAGHMNQNNNNILGREEAFTSFDSKNIGSVEQGT